MVIKQSVIEVSPTLFLNSLPAEQHAVVKGFFNDPKIDHVVLMVRELDGQRTVVTVARNGHFKSISEVTSQVVDGWLAKAYVDARKPFPDLSKKHSPRKHVLSPTPTRLAKQLESKEPQPDKTHGQLHALQIENDRLKRELTEAHSKLLLRETTIKELKKELVERTGTADTFEYSDESILSDREKAVEKAEEELIQRLSYLMEKEAELEQFQENLEDRERQLDDRDSN